MRRALLVIALSLGVLGTAGDTLAQSDGTEGIEISSGAFGARYCAFLSREMLEQSPRWSEADENPPLSARRAIQAATEAASELVQVPGGIKLSRMSATLERAHDDYWYWVVEWEWKRRLPQRNKLVGVGRSNLRLAVLMNGDVVTPRVEPSMHRTAEQTDGRD